MKNGLPVGWVTVPLQEVAEVRLGRQRSPDKATGEHMRPYMRAANVTWSGISVDDVKEMNFSPKEFPTYELRDGDILLSEASGSASEVGKPAVWRNEVDGCCFQNTLIRVRSRGPLPEYLHLHFLADARLGKFAAAGKGIGINHLGADRMSTWPTAIPPLNEQRRIVAKLEAFQARSRRAREALEAVPPLLEKLRQSILASAFRGDLTKDWREKHPDVEPASELLKRIRILRRKTWEEAELAKMKAKGKAPGDDRWKAKYVEPKGVEETGLPGLPAGWCWASVEELATKVVDGVHKKPNYVQTGIPFLTVRNLTAGPGISFEKVSYISAEDHAEFIKRTDPELGDILISKDGTLGVPRLVRTDRTFSIFVSLAVVKPVVRNMGEFLECAFMSPFFQERFKATGSGLLHIHLVDLRAAVLPIAPVAEQVEVCSRTVNVLARLDAFVAAHATNTSELAALERAVLGKAFCGELVGQDQNDEPAGASLARLHGGNSIDGKDEAQSRRRSRGDKRTRA